MAYGPLAERLRQLRYFHVNPLPDIDAYLRFDLSDPVQAGHVERSYAFSTESRGVENILLVDSAAEQARAPTPFKFFGSGNTVIIDRDCKFQGFLEFWGSNNVAVIFGGQSHLHLGATLYEGDALVWGRRSSCWGALAWVQGGTVLTIGDDCMLSGSIFLRTTDNHSIVDLDTCEQINYPEDITLDQRVWIAQNCTILKGVHIGAGSIIGGGSLVTHDVPSAELWAGVPAKMLRRNVSWIGSHPRAAPDEIEQLRAMFGQRRPQRHRSRRGLMATIRRAGKKDI